MNKSNYGNHNLSSIFNQIADLVMLNLLFVISCIPVLTIGTALISLFGTVFERMENPDTYIWKSYRNVFKKNLKQGILLWLIILAALALLYADMTIINSVKPAMSGILMVILGIFMLLVVLMAIYAFPLQAKYPAGIKRLLQNSLFISMAYLPYSLLMLGMFLVCAIITFWSTNLLQEMLFIWLLCGFSAMACLQAKIINGLLDKIQ